MSIQNQISSSLEQSLQTKKQFWANNQAKFFEIAEIIYQCSQKDKKILIFGNGGSACDALHFAGEWVNRYKRDRKALAAIALTADAALLTCIGNDSSFDEVFSRQVEGLGQAGDVAIGISTSGNSENVLRALVSAKSKGMTTIALLGRDGGKMLNHECVDHALNVSESQMTSRIQETHEWILHAFCEYVDFKIIGPDPDYA
ncbi:SIS domain-containing protein [bacterium]|nr:SIS domain-containing protein [bacterium]